MMKVVSLFLVPVFMFTSLAYAKDLVTLREVRHDQVCMVNNKFMGEDQIPVPFEGKTYYGCCEMCVTKLQGDKTSRTAIDPLTGKSVDKASAYIVMKPDKKVLYFASKDTFVKYIKTQKN